MKKPSFFILRRECLVCLLFVIGILAIYWQVGNNDFINFDDKVYVTENQYVQAGLDVEGLKWAFTTMHGSNWHPLTWLSHMLDCQLYGLNPKGHHLTNVLFHILNTILLFLIFQRMTGALWKSALVASLFTLHPLHVESVAWVAERKDVLSTFFWMLTMGVYVFYVENPGIKKYLLTILLFALGLMAKPMLVTLPFVLLLLDFWPLGRFRVKKSDSAHNSDHSSPKETKDKKRKPPRPLAKNVGVVKKITRFDYQWSLALPILWEKLPFFILVVISSTITFFAQQSGGAVSSLDAFPLTVRISNALVSYVSYMGKMIWPFNLAVLYPHPGMLADWKVAGACLLLLSISFMAIRMMKKFPYFIVGWLWYLGTLVPVIGLVQVGSQAMADRYTYVPLIGIFIIIVWGISDLTAGWRYRKGGIIVVSVTLLSILIVVAWFQVRHWTNSITLFRHTINATENNSTAHNSLGVALDAQGKTEDAIYHYKKALEIKPSYSKAYYNLGNALSEQGRISDAIVSYTKALEIKPDYERAHCNLGAALVEQGRIEEAIIHYTKALAINPIYFKAHYNLGNALAKQGKFVKALSHYTEALKINPDHADTHFNLGNVLIRQGKLYDAIDHYSEALRINPDDAEARDKLKVALDALQKVDVTIKRIERLLEISPEDPGLRYDLGNLYYKKGEFDEAISQYKKSLSIKPDAVEVLNNLAIVYIATNEYEKTLSIVSRMAELQPDNASLYYDIACMYSKQKKVKKSINALKKAIEKGYDNWDLIKADKDLVNIRSSLNYQELLRGH